MFGRRKRKKKKKVMQPNKKESKTNTKSVTYVSSYLKGKTCHTDPCEIIPNFWIGSSWKDEELIKKCSIYVPLSSADGYMWDDGWRGEILYIPIVDYQALPIDVLQRYAERIVTLLNDGHVVSMHCVGGHGRTGYMASAVVWLLGVPQKAGYTDPVGWLRDKYCEKSVESHTQLVSLEEFTGVKLVGNYKEKSLPVRGFHTRSLQNQWVGADYTAEYDHYYENQCHSCMHCDIDYAGVKDKYLCDLGYDTGTLCARYYAWSSSVSDSPVGVIND